MTAQDSTAWSVLKVRELLDRVNSVPGFKDDDLWFGLLGEHPVIVVKQAVLDTKQMSLDDAVRRVHRSLVASAMQKGLPVPGEVARELQLVSDAGAESELS